MKKTIETSPRLFPLPVVLVTTARAGEKPNIITISWIGVCCSEPPIIGVAVRKNRHSYRILKESNEFVVNIPDENLLWATDKCGTISGKDADKFELCGLTAEKCEKVSVPAIAECPVHLECKIVNSMELGSHGLFLGEVKRVAVRENLVDKNRDIDLTKMKVISYSPADHYYWSLGKRLEFHGFSKKKTKSDF